MKRKIIFFDIDGTILTEDTRIIPDSAVKAIREARKNGHLAFINTGRTFVNIEERIKEIGFDGYVCGCGTYINIDGKVLLEKPIPKDTCRDIINKLRECKIEALLEGLEDIYFDNTEFTDKEMFKMKQRFEMKGLGISKNWNSEGIQFDKIFAVEDEQCNMQGFRSYFEKEFDFIDRGQNRWEIIQKGYSKATGIEYLLNYYNIPRENSYAVGDSSNDLSMLEYVENAIAMGKSDKCVFKIASFITKDINDHGIWHALKHYRIIMPGTV